jgi:hypothetical protein
MSILYRGPFIDASYQVSVHLAKWLQMRRFLKIGQLETRMACGMWWSCLLMGQGYILFAKSCFRFLGKSETCSM